MTANGRSPDSLSTVEHQPWIVSARYDLLWIVGPAFFVSCLMLLLPSETIAETQDVPLWVWVLTVLGIDVAHVYSTLFRTYFSPKARDHYGMILWVIPLACFAIGVLLYASGEGYFWSVLAYLAVIHFVRQQYGFMRVYGRSDTNQTQLLSVIETLAVYVATIYPLIYWHSNLPRNFHWFIDGDFVVPVPSVVERIVWAAYLLIFGSLLLMLISRLRNGYSFNQPKLLVIIGTALAWYTGIVYFNSDLPFTVTNVVAHGVPYIALVWFFYRRTLVGRVGAHLLLFLGAILLFAYFEEWLWDGFVWRERLSFFSWASKLPILREGSVLTLLVPLLALPQATHYVLDAFIWRLKKPDQQLNEGLLKLGTDGVA